MGWSFLRSINPRIADYNDTPTPYNENKYPDKETPNMWTLDWGPDYHDENNRVGDVLWCENPGGRKKRTCNEIDMIVEARVESAPAQRIALYHEIKGGLFGYEFESKRHFAKHRGDLPHLS